MTVLHVLKTLDFTPLFAASARSDGKKYFEEGRVSNITCTDLGPNRSELKSFVQGRDIYQTSITASQKNGRINLISVCSCPVEYSCKHAVALLYHYQSYQSDDEGNPLYLQNWFRSINQSLEENQSVDAVDNTFGLYYFLHHMAIKVPEISVGLELIRHLKVGGLGGKKKFSNSSVVQKSHLLKVDHALIRELEVSQRMRNSFTYDGKYKLTLDADEKTLRQIIETGRCFWQNDQKRTLSLAEPKSAQLIWVTDKDGAQQLKLNGDHEGIQFFFIENLWGYDSSDASIFPVQQPLSIKVLKNLLSMPSVQAEHTHFVSNFLDKTPILKALGPPKAITVTTLTDVLPIPHLRFLSKDWKERTRAGMVQYTMAMAELSFDYQGVRIPWQRIDSDFKFLRNHERITIKRDLISEKKAIETLRQAQAFPMNETQYNNKTFRDFSFCFCLNMVENMCLEFDKYVVPKLKAMGWMIEYDADYPYQVVQDDEHNWYSSIEESQENNWFDVELGIDVNGKKVNLLPILKNILNDYDINELENMEGTTYLRLDEQHLVQIPVERVSAICKTLVEILHGNGLDNEKLHLSKYESTRLLEIEAAIGASELRWFGGERQRSLAAKLGNFSGIKEITPPAGFLAELRHYQQEGLSWLQFLREYELGGILADDMGLGKTIQTLSHISCEKASGRMQTPCLVVAPTSLMFNWQMEAAKFAPDLKALLLHGSKRKILFGDLLDYDLILTTYPLIVKDKALLLEHEFHLLILDEAQYIKNSKTISTQVALQLKAKHRLCLTGTPMENHLGELWSLFHFLMPGFLGNLKQFNQRFRHPIEKKGDTDSQKCLQKMIHPFMLRRTKSLVATELPEKVEMTRYVELEGKQRDLYETIRVAMNDKIQKEIARLGFAKSQIVILDALLKLRQVCCDPRLLKVGNDKNILESAKLQELMALLRGLKEEGRRVLLFSNFAEMLSLIEESLNEEGMEYLKLTGQTKNRSELVGRFQEGHTFLFLISLKAGGVGLNLTAADTVIHYDPWWNPAAENQATDRAYRIGQEKGVFVYKLVTKNTVEEKILAMQERKQALIDGLLAKKQSTGSALTEDDLKGLFENI